MKHTRGKQNNFWVFRDRRLPHINFWFVNDTSTINIQVSDLHRGLERGEMKRGVGVAEKKESNTETSGETVSSRAFALIAPVRHSHNRCCVAISITFRAQIHGLSKPMDVTHKQTHCFKFRSI